jgi:hypothetical protein
MSMPEAAMDKDDCTVLGQNNIWSPKQPSPT